MENSGSNQREAASQVIRLDPAKVQHMLTVMRSEQSVARGASAGAVAALVGAGVWALITVVIKYQIGFMAVGIGFLVGHAIRKSGQGIDSVFGIMGAIYALFGCLLGNLLAVCGVISISEEMPFGQVLSMLTPELGLELLKITFHPMDLLFYGIALYEGYKISFRRITETELRRVVATE
jgi:hypothetical protein